MALGVRERAPRARFLLPAIVHRIEAVHTLADKQEIMRMLYDHFFSQAFPRMSERLGIVFTPVEVADFIIRSPDDAMRTAFG